MPPLHSPSQLCLGQKFRGFEPFEISIPSSRFFYFLGFSKVSGTDGVAWQKKLTKMSAKTILAHYLLIYCREGAETSGCGCLLTHQKSDY